MKIGFFETQPGEDIFFKQALPQDELFFDTKPITPETISKYTNLEIITSHTNSKIDQTIINSLPQLKYISTRTTGFDHIDIEYAKANNILVSNVPSYGEITVAEFTFGLILSLTRKIPQAWHRVKQTKKFDTTGLTGIDLQGKTLGVLGTGKIGTHLIKMAKGFDMKILAFDPYPNEKLAAELGYTYTTLDDVLSNSDIISFHVPYLPSTHHLLNAKNISNIKRGALLINSSRGAVIETQALIAAIEQGGISAAALDVLENEEELNINNANQTDTKINELNKKLMSLPQVIITPHLAFDSKEALQRILQTTVENINAYKNNTPQNLVKLLS